METKSIVNKNEAIKVLLGTWAGGNCLAHLKLIEPRDATDPDVAAIIAQIKNNYYKGINSAAAITIDEKNELLADLKKHGYDKTEVIDIIDGARGRDTEYISAVAKLLEQKRTKLLKDIDWSKKGSDKQAAEVLKTFSIEGAEALKVPAVNPADKLLEECRTISEAGTISAGTAKLTNITGGFKPKQLVVIGAGTSIGKTAFSLQIAVEAAKAGKKVLHAPLEMSAAHMAGRMIARITGGEITNKELDNITKLPEEKIKMIEEACKEVNRLTSTNLLFLESERELMSIKRQLEIYRPDMMVIDQLSLMEDSQHHADSIRLMYKHLVESLKFMAMDYDCTIVLLAQVNRDGLTKQESPNMHNLQESAAIEQTADVVFILHIPDEEQRTNPDCRYADMTVRVDKFRGGQAGYIIDVVYDYHAQTIYDVPEKYLAAQMAQEIENEKRKNEDIDYVPQW